MDGWMDVSGECSFECVTRLAVPTNGQVHAVSYVGNHAIRRGTREKLRTCECVCARWGSPAMRDGRASHISANGLEDAVGGVAE